MKLMVSTVALALVAISLAHAAHEQQPTGINSQSIHQQKAHPQQHQPQHHQVTNDRQGRSYSNSGNSNSIDHGNMAMKSKELQRKDPLLQDFFTPRNLIKNIIKLLFGSPEESQATSRNALSVIASLLEVLKKNLGQKSRSGGRTYRDTAEDAANAGVSILQGYVKSVLAKDDRCIQRYLCQASKEAAKDGRDVGYIVSSLGGYVSSYLLDGAKPVNFKSLVEASSKGRATDEDCMKVYECAEDNKSPSS